MHEKFKIALPVRLFLISAINDVTWLPYWSLTASLKIPFLILIAQVPEKENEKEQHNFPSRKKYILNLKKELKKERV